MKLLLENWRRYLNEDKESFIKTAEEEGLESFFDREGGPEGIKAAKPHGRKLKDIFRRTADYGFLEKLKTVHWGSPQMIFELLDNPSGEISCTMTLPSEPLTPYGVDGAKHKFGLLVKGRITLAANSEDYIYSGHFVDYEKDKVSRYPAISFSADELGDDVTEVFPYVLDEETWDPQEGINNEAIVDNWMPISIICMGECPDEIKEMAHRFDIGIQEAGR